MTEQNWQEESEADPITLKAFEELCEGAFKQRQYCDSMEDELKSEKSKLNEMQLKIQAQLEELGKDNYKAKDGTVYIQSRLAFKVPADPDSRTKFFDYLKEKGAFDSLITVNYQTLNSFCKQEIETALAGGKTGHRIPGIEDPTVFRELRMRKGK